VELYNLLYKLVTQQSAVFALLRISQKLPPFHPKDMFIMTETRKITGLFMHRRHSKFHSNLLSSVRLNK
jgi:hypothetical protein